MTTRVQKVGGLTFVRIGSLSLSFCITRKPAESNVNLREAMIVAALTPVAFTIGAVVASLVL